MDTLGEALAKWLPVLQYNHNHGPDGEFTSDGGGGGYSGGGTVYGRDMNLASNGSAPFYMIAGEKSAAAHAAGQATLRSHTLFPGSFESWSN